MSNEMVCEGETDKEYRLKRCVLLLHKQHNKKEGNYPWRSW
jgi:hypothetical protein